MASRTHRLYALTVAVVLFLVAWVAIADRPWLTETTAPAIPRTVPDSGIRPQEQRIALKVGELRALLAAQSDVPAESQALTSQPAPASPPARITRSAPVTQSQSS